MAETTNQPDFRQALRAAGEQGMAALKAAAGPAPMAPGNPQPEPEPGPMAPAGAPLTPAGMTGTVPPAAAPAQLPAVPAQPAAPDLPAPSTTGEGGAETQPQAELTEIALPAHLHQQGFEALQVPQENAPVLEALVASAKSGEEIYAERVAVQQAHQANLQKFEDAVASLTADPFGTYERIAQATGTALEEIEMTAQLWFLNDQGRLDRLRQLLDETQENDSLMRAAVAERNASLTTRRTAAQQRLAYQRGETDFIERTQNMVVAELQKVPEQRRQFAFQNIATQINQWLKDRGYGRIADAEVMGLVGQWTGMFPGQGVPAAVQQGQELMRLQAEQRKKALTVMPGGASPSVDTGAPTTPTPGATLSDVGANLARYLKNPAVAPPI